MPKKKPSRDKRESRLPVAYSLGGMITADVLRRVLSPAEFRIYTLTKDLITSGTSIDEKIEQAFDSLREASALIRAVEQSLEDRSEKLAALHQEYERYTKLTEAKEGEVKALLDQVEVSLNKGKPVERWVSFAINIVAGLFLFVFGIAFGPSVTTWLSGVLSQQPQQAISSISPPVSVTETVTIRPTAVQDNSFPCQPGQIKGNRESKIYHLSGDQDYIRISGNVECFESEEEAKVAGYRKAMR